MALSAGAALGALMLSHAWAEPAMPRWRGPVLVDGPVRTAVRAERFEARVRTGRASDVLMWVMMAYPFVDAGVAALGSRGSARTGWQMVLMNAQAMAIGELAGLIVKRAVARERPFVSSCATEGHPSCGDADVNQSFYSGHASKAFTGAGLVCAHHGALPLYGGGLADAGACATGIVAATAVAMLRVAADEHYLSDVLVGAGVGLTIGYVFPAFFHYRRGATDDGANPRPGASAAVLMPLAGRRMGGIAVIGSL